MSLCLTCPTNNILKGRSTVVAKWLKDDDREDALPPNRPDVGSKRMHPKNSTLRLRMKVAGRSAKSRKVLYWAARPRGMSDTIRGAKRSYGDYSNMGVAYVDKDGYLRLKLAAPRPYKEGGKVWPPHIHYVFANRTDWSRAVHTIGAYPGHHGRKIGKRHEYEMECIDMSTSKCSILTPQQVKTNWKKLVVVSALPRKYGIDYRVNEQMYLPYDTKDEGEIEKACKKIGNRPYVIYCAKRTCHASSMLMARMIKKGCNNVYYMPGGTKEWNRQKL